MIVVEGIDGSGKSNLIKMLSKDLMIPVHKRASASLTGPVKNVWEWARDDVTTMYRQRFQIYDRHPLISEQIYGPIAREAIDGRFHTAESTALCRLFAESVLLIYCDPGILEVRKNIEDGEHMAGVSEHWRQIYFMYHTVMSFWPGEIVTWDYRAMDMYPRLRSICTNFMALRKTEFQR